MSSSLHIKLIGTENKGVIRLHGEIPGFGVVLTAYSIHLSATTGMPTSILVKLEPISAISGGSGDGSLANQSNFGNNFMDFDGINLALGGGKVTLRICDRHFVLASRFGKRFKYALYNGGTGEPLDLSTLVEINMSFNIKSADRIL